MSDEKVNVIRKFTTDANFLTETIRAQGALVEDTSKWQIHDDGSDAVAFEVSDDSLQLLLTNAQTISGAKTFSSEAALESGLETNTSNAYQAENSLKVGSPTNSKYMLNANVNSNAIENFPGYVIHDTDTTEGEKTIEMYGDEVLGETSLFGMSLTEGYNYLFTIDAVIYKTNGTFNAYTLKASVYYPSAGSVVINNQTMIYEHEDTGAWDFSIGLDGSSSIEVLADVQESTNCFAYFSMKWFSQGGVPPAP